jgi:GT2 family glycosyltransferase
VSVPTASRIKFAVARFLRGAWSILPAGWTLLVYRTLFAAAAVLPGTPRARARTVISMLRAEHALLDQDYPTWVRLYERTGEDARRAATEAVVRLEDPPLISILMTVRNPVPDHLRAAIESVRNQFYPHWELYIAQGASTNTCIVQDLNDASLDTLLWEVQQQDRRIKVVIGPAIAAAANSALALASGSFIALLDQNDLLSPRALYEVALCIVRRPKADIIYSDADHVDEHGHRSTPYLKPDWSPDLMLAQNLINHLGVYRRDLVERIGGFRTGLKASQDYDLALRAVAETSSDRIAHLPLVLYHLRSDSVGCGGSGLPSQDCAADSAASARQAVFEVLLRGVPGVAVEPVPSAPSWNRVIYPVPRPNPLVSVVIPSRNHADMLARTMDGLLRRTDYQALEVLIVDNGSDEPAAMMLMRTLSADHRVRVLNCPGPFNYAALNNIAVRQANGKLILLLNNDVDVIASGWLHEMVAHAIRPGIGAVGAKLLYPDDTIQHAGVTVGVLGVAGHTYLRRRRGDRGYFGSLCLVRNVTAVTGACLMVRREAYLAVGGLDEVSLPVAFNDIDFCLKLVEKGYRNLWTPYAELYHLESASRGPDESSEKAARFRQEVATMRQRWGHVLEYDPYWNRNLSLDATDVALAFPPREGRDFAGRSAETRRRPDPVARASAGWPPLSPAPPIAGTAASRPGSAG